MKFNKYFFTLIILLMPVQLSSNSIKMVSTKPAANLLTKPNGVLDTQLLFNEQVIVHHEKDAHLFVSALEQEGFDKDKGWGPITGYVHRESLIPAHTSEKHHIVIKDLSCPVYESSNIGSKVMMYVGIGTKFVISYSTPGWHIVKLPGSITGSIERKHASYFCDLKEASDNEIRKGIIETAKLFLDSPYLWGGRSAYVKGFRTSVDCSGLVNLAYRVNGINLPRNSGAQLKKSGPIVNGKGLKPADLIFLARPENPKKIIHVMIYLGGDDMIDAWGFDNDYKKNRCVRLTTGMAMFGKPLDSLKFGEMGKKIQINDAKKNTKIYKQYIVMFGTFFHLNK